MESPSMSGVYTVDTIQVDDDDWDFFGMTESVQLSLSIGNDQTHNARVIK